MKNISTTLLNRINSKIQTPGNDNEPKVKILVSRAKTTVADSSYWTVEEMRTGTTLSDTSVDVRRLKEFGPPDRFYNSYIEGGKVRTAIREYPDYEKQKWKYQFEIGNGISTSVCFDGEWKKYRKRWQIVTEELPFLFWVNNLGALKVRSWGESEDFDLSTNVKSVKSIRGWKSVGEKNKDMGIVCAYIKNDGKAYYRNYCIQTNGDKLWESEKEIGTAKSLNLFLTNDYRLGISLEKPDGNIRVLLTERNWGGMAIAPDTINVAPIKVGFKSTVIRERKAYEREKLSIAPINLFSDLGYTLTDNKIHTAENKELDGDWGKIIDITVDHNLYNVFNGDFEISGEEKVYPDKVEKIGDKKYRLIFEGENDFNNIGEVATVEFLGNQATNAINLLYEQCELDFNPINLIPREKPVPSPTNIINISEEEIEITFDLPLIGELGNNHQSISITGNDYLYVTHPDWNGEKLELTYFATETKRKDDNTLIATIPDMHRISGEVKVKYEQTLGNLSGDMGVVKDFECGFMPENLKPRNPGHAHTLGIETINVEFLSREVTYDEKFAKIYMEVAPINIELKSTKVDEVDP